MHGTFKNTCIFATYAHWCAKTPEKIRENHARVHSKSLWAHLHVQKHCTGALKVTLGSQGRSKTPRNSRKASAGALQVIWGSFAHSKTLHWCTQSHFGLTQAVTQAIILLVNMHAFCMGPQKTHVFLLPVHMGPSKTRLFSLLLRIGAYDFVCGALLCSIMHVFCMGPQNTCVCSLLCVFVATVLFVGRGFAPKHEYMIHGTHKNTCIFSVFCVLVYTLLTHMHTKGNFRTRVDGKAASRL